MGSRRGRTAGNLLLETANSTQIKGWLLRAGTKRREKNWCFNVTQRGDSLAQECEEEKKRGKETAPLEQAPQHITVEVSKCGWLPGMQPFETDTQRIFSCLVCNTYLGQVDALVHGEIDGGYLAVGAEDLLPRGTNNRRGGSGSGRERRKKRQAGSEKQAVGLLSWSSRQKRRTNKSKSETIGRMRQERREHTSAVSCVEKEHL